MFTEVLVVPYISTPPSLTRSAATSDPTIETEMDRMERKVFMELRDGLLEAEARFGIEL
jgi:hypothetical protein